MNDDFYRSLTKNDEIIKQIVNPIADIQRDKARASARRGDYPRSGCPHPIEALEQYVDDDPSVQRNGRACNLFECSVCHSLLWLVDPYGEAASDGI